MNQTGDWYATTAPENKYQYNGKELNEELGLNWNDYGARYYDAAVGRFFSTDRFAEKYYSMNPYQYGAANPINFIDVNGDSLAIFLYSWKGGSGVTGHNAVLILDSDEKWNYISKDGGSLSSSGESIYTVRQFESLEDFANADIGASVPAGEFYEGFMVETSAESNDGAIEAATEAAERDYLLGCDDCTHTMEAAVNNLESRDGEPLNYNNKKTTEYSPTGLAPYIPSRPHKVTTPRAYTPKQKFNLIKRQNKGKTVDFSKLKTANKR